MSYRPITDVWILARPKVQPATDPLPRHHLDSDMDIELGWPALIADPPYTEADAEHYAPGRDAFPSANKILRNMLDVVRVGGRVGMLHYVLPQPPREGVRFVACVGVICGYNNRMRVFSVFEREDARARAMEGR